MRRLFVGLSLLAGAASLSGGISPEFASRRAELRKSIPDGVLILFGAKEPEDLHQGFFQSTDFYYLTGWEQPSAILILTPDPDKGDPDYAERANAPRELLFLPQRSLNQEKWTGRKAGPNDPEIAAFAGFAKVMPAERFESELRSLLELYPAIYALTEDPTTGALRKLAPLRTVTDARRPISLLRMAKSQTEIAAIRHATDASVDAHRAAWNAIRPGMYEYQIAALMLSTYMNEGCSRSAYAPIVASGPNAETLHYSLNTRRIEQGDLVVMDVGAECSHYASDITRTIPAGGKFTPRQRELYEIVLGAQRAAIAAVKPGATIGRSGLYKIAYDYINSHGRDVHGQPLGQYFIHGLSHHVGLDVHDAADNTEPLKAGMVITVEPGVYIPEENIGIRIEDTVLVTETGSQVLSAALPAGADEVERAMAQRN